MNRITLKQIAKQNVQSRSTRFSVVGALVVLCALASTAQCQTATYSDSYVIDNSGVTYDPENDAYVYPEEPGPPALIVGVGVTDAGYNSYSESVTTTLTSPDGRSFSNVSYADPYARVEVTMTPIDDDNEYEYDIETVHSYWLDEPDPGSNCVSGMPCILQTAYRASPLLSFFRIFTSAWIRVRVARSDYQFTGSSIVPPPFLARLCFMGKICGSCGGSTGILQTLSWRSCPSYLGVVFLRYSTPFGSWCVQSYWTQNILYFCT